MENKWDMSSLSDDLKGMIAELLRFSEQESMEIYENQYYDPEFISHRYEFDDELAERHPADTERLRKKFGTTKEMKIRKTDLESRETTISGLTRLLKEFYEILDSIDQKSTDPDTKHEKFKLWLQIIRTDEQLENEKKKYNYMKACYSVRNFVDTHSKTYSLASTRAVFD